MKSQSFPSLSSNLFCLPSIDQSCKPNQTKKSQKTRLIPTTIAHPHHAFLQLLWHSQLPLPPGSLLPPGNSILPLRLILHQCDKPSLFIVDIELVIYDDCLIMPVCVFREVMVDSAKTHLNVLGIEQPGLCFFFENFLKFLQLDELIQ